MNDADVLQVALDLPPSDPRRAELLVRPEAIAAVAELAAIVLMPRCPTDLFLAILEGKAYFDAIDTDNDPPDGAILNVFCTGRWWYVDTTGLSTRWEPEDLIKWNEGTTRWPEDEDEDWEPEQDPRGLRPQPDLRIPPDHLPPPPSESRVPP